MTRKRKEHQRKDVLNLLLDRNAQFIGCKCFWWVLGLLAMTLKMPCNLVSAKWPSPFWSLTQGQYDYGLYLGVNCCRCHYYLVVVVVVVSHIGKLADSTSDGRSLCQRFLAYEFAQSYLRAWSGKLVVRWCLGHVGQTGTALMYKITMLKKPPSPDYSISLGRC
jgi:hypothetical protein